MHNLLSRLLDKRKIKSIEELSNEPIIPGMPSEKEEFDKFQRILSKESITVADIANFCNSQIKLIQSQWKNLDNSITKNERLIQLHTVYSILVDLIASPSKEKEDLERYLTSLLT